MGVAVIIPVLPTRERSVAQEAESNWRGIEENLRQLPPIVRDTLAARSGLSLNPSGVGDLLISAADQAAPLGVPGAVLLEIVMQKADEESRNPFARDPKPTLPQDPKERASLIRRIRDIETELGSQIKKAPVYEDLKDKNIPFATVLADTPSASIMPITPLDALGWAPQRKAEDETTFMPALSTSKPVQALNFR